VSGLEAGSYVFTLTVTDDQGASSSAEVSIVVKQAANQLPVIVLDTAKNIYSPNTSTVLDGSASYDPDGKIVNYSWKQVSGPSDAAVADTTQAKTQVSNLVNGTYTFTLTVTDDRGGKASKDIAIGVYDIPNQPPVAQAGHDRSIILPQDSVMLDGSASYDPDGRIVSYQWEAMTGPSQAIISNQNSAVCRVEGLETGTYDFKLTVTDNNGAIGVATVSVYVVRAQDTTATKFRIYPNPVHDQLQVELNKDVTGLIMFRIIDVNGRVAKTYQFGALPAHFSKALDVNGLAAGIYFIQLIEDNQLRDVKKMIKY
jgi:hypothetical protein